jgi:hypothetical protein
MQGQTKVKSPVLILAAAALSRGTVRLFDYFGFRRIGNWRLQRHGPPLHQRAEIIERR